MEKELKLNNCIVSFIDILGSIKAIQDNDGLFFDHYYNDCITDKDFVMLLLLRIVNDKIVEYTGNPNVCQKWIWYSNFLQQFIIEK